MLLIAMQRMRPLMVGLALGVSFGGNAQEAPAVQGLHEVMNADSQVDDLGIAVPVPISHPARRYPANDDFPTGPAVGERLPEFQLPNQNGELVDFHKRQRSGNAVVVFFRSAMW